MTSCSVLTPVDREGLVAALARATPRSRLVAGGTDLVKDLQRPGAEPDLLIDLSGLTGLASVRLDGGRLRIGALATFAQLEREPLVAQYAACLEQAAAAVGSVQIRNAATLGGNVANASPCADGATALVALDADMTTVDGTGRSRTRPVGQVLEGPGATSLAHDECVVEFSFTALEPTQRSAFAKVGYRTAVSVARLNMALVVGVDESGVGLTAARVGLGAVGATAFRDARLEAALAGRPVNAETAQAFAAACTAAVRRSIPDRPSVAYKQHAAVGLAYDAWNRLGLSPPFEPHLAV